MQGRTRRAAEARAGEAPPPLRSGAATWTLALLAAVAAWGCGGEEITASVDVRGLTPIEPDSSWARIYRETEECTGTQGDFSRVDWFRAASIDDRAGEPSGGAWLVAEGRPHGIALLDRLLRRGTTEEVNAVVRHEVIHEILQLGSHDGQVWCRCDDRPSLFPQCG